jgi:hypothetical protein
MRTTVGQLLINRALPEPMRDYNRVLNKDGMKQLFNRLATEFPDQYREVSKKLADIGREVATESGGNSFGIEHMMKAKAGLKYQQLLKDRLKKILDRDDLSDEQRHELIIRASGDIQDRQIKEIMEESVAEGNPLARQVSSGTRGNEMNLASLRGSDVLYTDHHGNTLPIPVTRSYSQGLSPVEYQAGTYGARKGVMATKFATQDAGFLSKQLNQINHRLMVVGDDYDDEEQQILQRGFPVDTDDMDNEGALLAMEVGQYPKNTVLTPKILKDLKRRGFNRIAVRSPAVGGSPEGGIYARDAGVRERGVLPGRGEQVGLQSAQALSEPISQGQLSAKHSGGVAGQEKAVGGFAAIDQLVQTPEAFKGGAAHSEEDGVVQRIEPAPAGGHYVYVNNQQHYVAQGYGLKVKRGQMVEAGDVLSDGMPNPAIITKHKGVGEGRHYFVSSMRSAMRDAGMKVNRRNLEVLARGLINHVRLADEIGDDVEGTVLPYSTLEHTYQPREGYKTVAPAAAAGMYLERPVLHYTIGTKLRPSVVRTLNEFGVQNVDAHPEALPFEPEMIRGMDSLKHDPDWQTRLYGSKQKSSLLDAVHHGGTSTSLGTSFVPGLAKAVDFGRVGLVRQPEPGKRPEDVEMPKKSLGVDLNKLKPAAPTGSMMLKAGQSQQVADALAAQTVLARVGQQLGYVKRASENGTMSTGKIDRQPAAPKPSPSPLHAGIANVPGSSAKTPSQPATTPKPQTEAATQPQPQSRAQYTANGTPNYMQNAAARYSNFENQGGYSPGQTLLTQMDQADDLMRFVSGNNQGNFEQGFGGLFGAATRLGTMLDPNAIGTLTSGGHAPQEYNSGRAAYNDIVSQDPQRFGYGMGGVNAPAATVPTEGSTATGGWSFGPTNLAQQGPGLGQAAFTLGTTGLDLTNNINQLNTLRKGVTPAVEAAAGAAKAPGLWAKATNVASKVPGMSLAGKGLGLVGKLAAPVEGALNLGWAPAQAVVDLAQGETEEAGKNFYDPNWQPGKTGYVSGVMDAMGPSKFYKNITGLSAGVADSNTYSGVGQGVLGMVGMDANSRHNQQMQDPAYRAQMKTQFQQQAAKIRQHLTQRAVQRGHGILGPDGTLQPTQTWVQTYRARMPQATPEQMQEDFQALMYDS